MAEDPIVPWSEYASDPEFLNLPIGERLGLFNQWADATISRVQPYVQTDDDKKYVNDYLNQVRDSVLDTQTNTELLGNAIQRSMLRAKQAVLVDLMRTGDLDPRNEASLQLAEINQEISSLPASSTARKIGSDEINLASGDGWRQLFQDKEKGIVALAELMAENIPAQMLATAGAGVVGTAIAGPAGGTAAVASTAGLSSGLLETSGSILESLSERQIDLEDPEAIRNAFSDPELMRQVTQKAIKKAVPPAVIDAATAGIATKIGLSKLGNIKGPVAGAAVESVGGVAGETIGQVASEGKIVSPNQIVLEGLLEVPGGIADTTMGTLASGLNQIQEIQKADPITEMRQRELAEKLKKDGTIARTIDLANAGAPETARAALDASIGLEEEIEKASQAADQIVPESVEPTQAQPESPMVVAEPAEETILDRQNTLEAAQVWSNIRARKPVSVSDVERFGFKLPQTWALNPKTENFEFQGVPLSEAQTGKTPETPAIETAIEPTQVQDIIPQPAANAQEITPPVVATPVQPEIAQQSQTPIAPKVDIQKPKPVKVSEKVDLPKWEDVEKNKNQIRFLKSTLDKINKTATPEIKVEPKAGWKRADYYKALETQYGKLAGLEKNIEQVPGLPEPKTFTTENTEEKRNSIRKANLRKKLYSIRDSQLTGEQQIWKENAFGLARKIAGEVAQRYQNVPGVEDYVFDDLLRKTANHLQKNKEIGDEQLTQESIKPILASWADDSAKDAGQNAEIKSLMQSSPILDVMETSDQPAKTQVELDEEEKIVGETRQYREQLNAQEPPATKILKDNGYTPAREKLGPDQKLVLDWIVNKLTTSATPSGIETKNLKTYEDLASFLTTANKKKVTPKAVSKMATEAKQALADELQKAGLGVTADQISTALTPEGEQARTRAKEKADKDAAIAKEKQEKQTLADRGRNATQNQYLAEKLVDAGMRSTPDIRPRIISEVIEPLEGGTLEDTLVEERIANIEKGLPNEPITQQPGTSEPIPERQGSPGLRQQPSVQQSPRPSPTPEQGAAVPNRTDSGKSQPKEVVGSRPRSSRRRPPVGEEQRKASPDVSPLEIDRQLTSDNNFSKPTIASVKELLGVMQSLGVKAKVALGNGGDNPIYVRKGDRQGLTIYVNPEALNRLRRSVLRKFKGEEGPKRWAQWQLMAVATHETVHNVHLKQLEKEAGQLGLTFDQHLYNEARRVNKFLNRNPRLKKYIARIYNDSNRFENLDDQYFEFVRMLVENETMGRTTETSILSSREIAAAMDDRWFTRLIDNIVEALTNLSARIFGTNRKDAEYLLTTTKLLKQLNRDIINPPRKERVSFNYTPPTKAVSKKQPKTKATKEKDILGASPVPSDRPVWLKPDGSLINVGEEVFMEGSGVGNHAEAALEFLRESEPNGKFWSEWTNLDPFDRANRNQSVIEEMLQRGWVRVVGDGFNIYFEGNPNQKQLYALFESAIQDEVKLIHDLTGSGLRARSKVVYEPPNGEIIGTAAMPRRGFLTTPKVDLGRSLRLPDSIDDLALVKDFEGGSHPVGLYEDIDGNRFIVKTDQSREQFENEVAAENVYRVLGYPVADSKLIEVDGKPAKIAEYIEDGLSLKEFEETHKSDPETIAKVYDQLADGLLIDAFLFNYDSIGVNYRDNVLIRSTETPTADGEETETIHTAYRIDSGGTFDTKGFENRPRNEPFFYDSLKILKKNYPYLKLTDSMILAQLSDLVLNSDAVLNAIPARLQNYMANRLQYMADQLSAIDILAPVSGVNETEIESFFQKMQEQLASVEVFKDNQGRLINKATGLPSMVSGLAGRQIPKSEFRYRLERTPLFKAWFGDWENNPNGKATSKIIDEAGEPKLMYHGTGSYLQKYSDLYLDEATALSYQKKPSYIRRFGLNRFKGIWSSPSRMWAEKWALNNNPEMEYHEQVVYPLYIKSTNPFDPRDKMQIDRLIKVLGEQGKKVDPTDEYTFKNGFYDWRLYEGAFDPQRQDYTMPDPKRLREEGVSEETIKRKYGATYFYKTLKAIVDLGHDGIWAREGFQDDAIRLEVQRNAEGLTKEPQNKEFLGDFRKALSKYNANSEWTFLAFRKDAAKSAMNTGLFSSVKDPREIKKSNEARKLEQKVRYEAETGRNKLEHRGQVFYSYESPTSLASYAVASDSALSRHNIAKTKLYNQENTYLFQKRTAPSTLATGLKPFNDILGTAEVKPRRFGVRLDKVIPKSIMDTLAKKNYAPLPDKLAMSLAEEYLSKNGLEASAAAVLAYDGRVRPGAQEMLGMLVLKKYRENIGKDPDAAVKMAAFIDGFLEKSTESGRALRGYNFLSLLGPEGMEALYYKKVRQRDMAMREKFDDFIRLASEKLKPLSQDALDKVFKEMETVLKKADALAKKNTNKIAKKTTMTLWQQFSDSVGKKLTSVVEEELQKNDNEDSTEQEGDGESKKIVSDNLKEKKGKTINQEMRDALKRIKNVIEKAAKEQGTEVKLPSENEEQAKTEEEIQQLKVLSRNQETITRLSDLVALWPKALQAWSQIKDSIREEAAKNKKLAPIFEKYLQTALDQPFTIPQIKSYLKASEIDLKSLIKEYYSSDMIDRKINDLAQLFVSQANLGTLGEKTETQVLGEIGKTPEPVRGYELEVEPTIAEKLQDAIASKITQTIESEALKTLKNLVQANADKRLEPNLKRFADRLIKLSSYGLLDPKNIEIWSEFARQEGLVKPEIAEEIYNIVKKADSLPEGYQRNVEYQKAMRKIYEDTQMNKWSWVMPWWYMSILSGLDTQGANFFGNLSQLLFVLIPEIVHGSVQYRGQKVYFSSLLNGLSRGWDDAMNIFVTGDSWTKPQNLSLTELMGSPNASRVIWENKKGIEKWLVGAPSVAIQKAMSAIDSLFYNLNKEFYLYQGALREIQKQKPNLKKKELQAEALALVARDTNSFKSASAQATLEGFEPGKRDHRLRTFEILDQIIGDGKTQSGELRDVDTQNLLSESVTKALINVYQQEPKGILGHVIQAINILASKVPQTRFIVPFTRIVGNVWNMSIDMTGYGLARYYGLGGMADKIFRLEGTKLSLKDLAKRKIGKDLLEWDDVSSIEKEMIRFRGLMGLTWLTLMAALASFGAEDDYEKSWFRINGGGPNDPQQKQALTKIGWKPWSLKVGNVYFSFLATPLAIPLAILGEYLDNQQYKKRGARAFMETGHASVTKAVLVPFDMVFLAGLSDTFKMMDSSQPEQAEARAKAFFARLGSSFLVPNFVRDVDQKVIPFVMDIFNIKNTLDEKTARTTLIDGVFVANTPFARRMGNREVDILGNRVETTSRIMGQSKKDPLVETLALKNAFPSPARRELLLGLIPMEEQEFYDFRKNRGEMLNKILNTPERIEQLKSSSPFVAQEIVKQATSAATEYAKGQAIKKMVEAEDPRLKKLQNLGDLIQQSQ